MNTGFLESSYEPLKDFKPGYYWYRESHAHKWVIVEVYFTLEDVPKARVCPTYFSRATAFREFRGELGPQIISPPAGP